MKMAFRVRLKKARKPTSLNLGLTLLSEWGTDVAYTFQATIGKKFTPLIDLRYDDMDRYTMTTNYNTALTDAASEILKQ